MYLSTERLNQTQRRSLRPDYGLSVYRRNDGAEPLSTYQQRLQEVYMPPEFSNSNMEPTLAGDVFRYMYGCPSTVFSSESEDKRAKNKVLPLDLQLLNYPAGDCHSQWPHTSKLPQWGTWHNKHDLFVVSCFWRILMESHVFQAEESNVESTWCPPLPELISSKADSTCPCPADYVEVCSSDIPCMFQTFCPFKVLCCATLLIFCSS